MKLSEAITKYGDVDIEDADQWNICDELEEPKPLECSGGAYSVESDGFIDGSLQGDVTVGNAYATKEEAIRASKLRVQLEIINNHIRQLNKKDSFAADWNDDSQRKYFIQYNYSRNMWGCSFLHGIRYLGYEYCYVDSAKYLVDRLNEGQVQGVDKHWED